MQSINSVTIRVAVLDEHERTAINALSIWERRNILVAAGQRKAAAIARAMRTVSRHTHQDGQHAASGTEKAQSGMEVAAT